MIDLNHQEPETASFAASFVALIDAAMQADNQSDTPRNYLGGSRLGEECARMLQYEFEGAPKSRQFPGHILRIFQRGHSGEALMADRLRLAGFTLVTEKADGGQLGFYTAWCSKTERYRIRGHYDGVITAAPEGFDLAVPCIWENKVLGAKAWKAVVKHGVRKEKPVYAGQVATYQAYSELTENPALFTAENGDTGEVYAELVPFDAKLAQECTDRGVQVLQASEAGDRIPRPYPDADFFKCKFCDYREVCWS
jgi:hypothetical protein